MGTIHFLNVKEGDCIFVQHSTGNSTVIDVSNGTAILEGEQYVQHSLGIGGNYNRKAYPVNPNEYIKKYVTGSIFRFILTHPDMDHMDGIKSLFEDFSITNFWDTNNDKKMDTDENFGIYDKEDWEFYQKIRKNINNPKVLCLYAGNRGKYFNEDENGNSGGDGLSILAPTMELVSEANKTKDHNDCSYVILYTMGNGKKVIFAGDSAEKTWEYILENHKARVSNVDVLIAPHHGRKTGGNDDYLDVLNPRLTLFGNAKSKYLDYASWNNRKLDYITNNQADCIILDSTKGNCIEVYVTYEKFAKDIKQDASYNSKFNAWHILSI